jgi:hypothetical protein
VPQCRKLRWPYAWRATAACISSHPARLHGRASRPNSQPTVRIASADALPLPRSALGRPTSTASPAADGRRGCCPRVSGQCRVGCGLDVTVHLRWVWAFKHALGEHDHGLVPGRVNQPRRVQSAVPAERAAVIDRLAEPPPPAVEESRQKALAGLLRGGQLVGGHGPHRVGWQARRPTAEQHPGECEQVVGGHEPAAPSPKSGGRLHLPPGSSSTTSPSGAGRQAVARRWVSAVQNPVSRMPSGSKIRV